MTIGFNDIPAQLRLPGWYIEFDNRLAGAGGIQQKVLILGQRLETGTIEAGVPRRVLGGEQAEEYFGRGSMLASMVHKLKAADRWMETWAIALDDDNAGVAATGSILVENIAERAGVIALYIAGERIRVGVNGGDEPAEIAQAIVDEIGENTDLPVTAEIDGSESAQVNLTCRWAGETGNDIDIRHSYLGEDLPRGISLTITAMADGVANPDVADAIAAMGDEWWNWIVMPYTDTANLSALEAELDGRFGPMRQIGGRAFAAFRGTHGEAGSFGADRNSPHVTVMATNLAPQPPWIWAAVNAIVAAGALAIDPARPLQTLALTGLLAPAEEVRWDDPERNMLLFDGMATYTVARDGTVQIERQVTTYQENQAGLPDTSYLDITTPETLERIRFRQRQWFAQRYPRHKLAGDDAETGPGQPVMKPKICKAELMTLYGEMERDGLVQDADGYQESLIVNIDADNPTRLNVQDSPKLVGQYRTHAHQTQFRR